MGRLIDADDVKKMISDTFEKEKDVITLTATAGMHPRGCG